MTAVAVSRPSLPAYPAAVALLAAGLFYTNLPLYLYVQAGFPAPPLYSGLAVLLLGSPILIRAEVLWSVLESRLFRWSVAYAAVTLGGFIVSAPNPAEIQEIRTRMLWVILLVAHLALFTSPAVRRLVRRMVLWALMAGIALGFYDLFHPGLISLSFGRASGLYLNPNIAGGALLSGLILVIDDLSPGRRSWLYAATSVAILATLSRSCILALVAVTLVLIAQGTLRARSLAAPFLLFLVGVAGVVAWFGGLGPLLVQLGVAPYRLNVWARILDPGSYARQDADPSLGLRVEAVRAGWQLFLEHPILGAGVGSTVAWPLPISTHNIYLRHLAELGLLGAWLYPAFLWSLLPPAGRGASRYPVRLCVVLGILGLFSHNMLDDWVLLPVVALAAMDGVGRDTVTDPDPGAAA